ncbi:MAG: hypothetical protein H6838_08405 [Planctomycetes bacterium]|nr:hypothetical protein [Planctomycetota bacterium]MCB9885499.1 hypothetical protein [Planctomycetota bacterium]
MKDSNNNQVIALGAMVLLLAAALMVGGGGTSGGGAASSNERLAAVETGGDHIGSSELATRILAGGQGMLLVDVRPADEYAAFHLPRAVNMTVPTVTADAMLPQLRQQELVVLYSNGPAHPAQAWVELTRKGLTNVRVLDGGLEQFRAEVLTPVSLREGGDEVAAKEDAARMALVRAFFLHPVAAGTKLHWSKDPAELAAPTVVSPSWLAERLGKVAVLDARASGSEYSALHVPGAVFFPVKPLRKEHGSNGPLFLEEPAVIADALGKAGVGNDTPVVIYAEEKMQDATLAALAMMHVGHRKLAILEGGLLRWAAEQRPLVAAVPSPAPVAYAPRAGADNFTIDATELHASLAKGMQVLDVRPADFFRGEKSTEARPGHIPGAKNRLYKQDLVRTDDGQYWRAPDELAREYAALGLVKDAPLTVSCRTGHTASESFFVLRYLLGYDNVRWYNGSWTDWAERKELPAAMGDGQ